MVQLAAAASMPLPTTYPAAVSMPAVSLPLSGSLPLSAGAVRAGEPSAALIAPPPHMAACAMMRPPAVHELAPTADDLTNAQRNIEALRTQLFRLGVQPCV